jgi:hypothetical protein
MLANPCKHVAVVRTTGAHLPVDTGAVEHTWSDSQFMRLWHTRGPEVHTQSP